MHLRQPVFTYTVRGPFTKERIQKVKETGNSQYIYQSELDKASFQHDMEILKISLEEQFLMKYCMIKHLTLLKFRNMIDINVALLQWSIIFLIKLLLVEQLKRKICQTKN